MANLTLRIDADLLRRARIRASERGTSVNAVVREFLEAYAGGERETAALQALRALADHTRASSGPGGRSWTRDEIHDRT